ncbi:hypothetical protein TNIN_334491 [Trichonephila inaurata madagascariensis]|uniref:Uncharacterized protein n=1 Tax=Trichonephila inaurata madagascariensis TaxID=2747483 RepID=A0A8X6YAA1_9ARAC|nr:hypothetical protein TNIN_334491 [Trichonephila inaurata madagascariensis]
MLLGQTYRNFTNRRRGEILEGRIKDRKIHSDWTVTGKTKIEKERLSNVLLSIRVGDNCIKDFWNLDILGIKDHFQKRIKIELEKAAEDIFERHVVSSNWIIHFYQTIETRLKED